MEKALENGPTSISLVNKEMHILFTHPSVRAGSQVRYEMMK